MTVSLSLFFSNYAISLRMKQTIAFLGCSRGFGRAMVLEMDRRGLVAEALLFSRNRHELETLAAQVSCATQIECADFSKPEEADRILATLQKVTSLKQIFYFAGGGPYGYFHEKKWQAHQWSIEVTLLTPLRLLHSLLALYPELQWVFVGSQVADCKGDPKAVSYAAAKHGLRGALESLWLENSQWDIRFIRPGYMNTPLLPKDSFPHRQGLVVEPEKAASRALDWLLSGASERTFDI